MNFSIVFENTKDAIAFKAIRPDVVEYFVNTIDQLGINKFSSTHSGVAITIKSRIKKLEATLDSINTWLGPLINKQFKIDSDSSIDQHTLNRLHADWVKSQSIIYDIEQKRQQLGYQGVAEQIHNMYPDDIRFVRLGDLLDKLGKKQEYNLLNFPGIHLTESSFSHLRFSADIDWIEIENPFPPSYVTNDICNLYLPFNHLGRTLYNKFINFDSNLEFDDENTFNELLKFVEINLAPPQVMPYSQEYVEWCKIHKRDPSGDVGIPLGNIPDLVQNLTKYRKIIMDNLLCSNAFTIKIH